MGIGITVVGPRKLDYPVAHPQHPTEPFRAAQIEFETNPLGSKSVTINFGIILELQLADAVLVVGLARDLIPHKIVQEVNLNTWSAYFEDQSSRAGMKLMLDKLSANVLPMIVGADRTAIARLAALVQSPPFTVHAPTPIDIGRTLGANIRPQSTYEHARDALPALLTRFERDPFLHATDSETFRARPQVVQ